MSDLSEKRVPDGAAVKRQPSVNLSEGGRTITCISTPAWLHHPVVNVVFIVTRNNGGSHIIPLILINETKLHPFFFFRLLTK